MSIRPAGHRLVVRAYKQEQVDPLMAKHADFVKSLTIVNDNKKREDASVDKGIVLAIGPTAWKDFGGEPWCKVGDEIIFAKFAGKVVTDPSNGEDVFILNDEDVCAVVETSNE